MLQKAAHPSANEGEKQIIQRVVSINRWHKVTGKKNFFCSYFHMDYCGGEALKK